MLVGSLQVSWYSWFYPSLNISITETFGFYCQGRFLSSLQLSCSVFIKSHGVILQWETPKANSSCLTATNRPNPPGGLGALPYPAAIPGSHLHCWAVLWFTMPVKGWVVLLVSKDPIIQWAIPPCSQHCSWPSFSCYDISYSHGPPNCLQELQFIPVSYLQPTPRVPLLLRLAFSIPFVVQKQQKIRNKERAWWINVSAYPNMATHLVPPNLHSGSASLAIGAAWPHTGPTECCSPVEMQR